MAIINISNSGGLSAEQMKLRCGKICASSIHKIMAPKGLGKTGETYLWQLMAERETGINASIPTNQAMQWGIDHEADAGKYYSRVTGHNIIQGSSITHGSMVVTPDFINQDMAYGVEVKCPHASYKQAQRIRYKDYKDVKKNLAEYYWQMVAGMIVTGFEEWKFVSYDPRFKDNGKKIVVVNVPYIKEDADSMNSRVEEAEEFFRKNNG